MYNTCVELTHMHILFDGPLPEREGARLDTWYTSFTTRRPILNLLLAQVVQQHQQIEQRYELSTLLVLSVPTPCGYFARTLRSAHGLASQPVVIIRWTFRTLKAPIFQYTFLGLRAPHVTWYLVPRMIHIKPSTAVLGCGSPQLSDCSHFYCP